LWNFGDGYTDNSSVASHSYSAAGSYDINLVVTSNFGCKDSIGATITVDESPVAKFSIANNEQCFNGNSFDFSDSSSIAYGTYTRLWSFGDGNISTLQSPNYTYTAVGTFTVKLVVVNANGCKDSTATNISVLTSPKSSFAYTGATNCTSNRTLVFADNSTNASSYFYDFGDGSTSSLPSTSHTYSTAGTKTATVTVRSGSSTITLVSNSAMVLVPR
jgi:PKD repeat protein